MNAVLRRAWVTFVTLGMVALLFATFGHPQGGGTFGTVIPSPPVGGDLSGNAGTATVTGIQTNPVEAGVLDGAATGYVLEWNGSLWSAQPASSTIVDGQDYSFGNVVSADISGYNVLEDNATGTESDLTAAVTSGGGKTLIKAFGTAANDPQVSIIPAGLWEFNYYAQVSVTGAFSTNLVFDVYTRTSGGAETLLFSASGGNIGVTSLGFFTLLYAYGSDTYVANTTRVVVKVSAVTTSVTSVTATFAFDGATHASLVRTPIAGDAVNLGGDLSGTTSAATVVGIQGKAIDAPTTQGDVYYYNGTAIKRLGAGTAGQVLTTEGTSSNPQWTTVSGGDGGSGVVPTLSYGTNASLPSSGPGLYVATDSLYTYTYDGGAAIASGPDPVITPPPLFNSSTSCVVLTATNATPIVFACVAAATPFATGTAVTCAGGSGNTGINGTWNVTLSGSSYTATSTVGNGVYTPSTATCTQLNSGTSTAANSWAWASQVADAGVASIVQGPFETFQSFTSTARNYAAIVQKGSGSSTMRAIAGVILAPMHSGSASMTSYIGVFFRESATTKIAYVVNDWGTTSTSASIDGVFGNYAPSSFPPPSQTSIASWNASPGGAIWLSLRRSSSSAAIDCGATSTPCIIWETSNNRVIWQQLGNVAESTAATTSFDQIGVLWNCFFASNQTVGCNSDIFDWTTQ